MNIPAALIGAAVSQECRAAIRVPGTRTSAQVSVPDVFAAPTVAALAARLRDGARGGLVPRPAGSAPVLAPAQRQMWTLYRVEGPAATYNVPRAWTVTGPFDHAAFQAAIADVVARHEILRTTYREDGAERVAYAHDAQTAVLEVLDGARQRGTQIEGLSVRGPSLEDVFLKLTGREFRE